MKKTLRYPLGRGLSHNGWEMRQTLEMPFGAKILSVSIQNGTPTIWALANQSAPMEKMEQRIIYITEADAVLGDEFVGRRFIGTLQTLNDSAVHVWE
jgi:hypothetical protein